MQSPPPCKLPALYLVDSIVKNHREPFTSLFARNLPTARLCCSCTCVARRAEQPSPLRPLQTFGAAWAALPQARQSLHKLYVTWQGVFPMQALAAVQHAHQLPVCPPPTPGSYSPRHATCTRGV